MTKITVESEKPMVIISLEEYETLKETVEVLQDEAVLYDIRMARKEYEEGRTKSLEEVEKEMGWDESDRKEDK